MVAGKRMKSSSPSRSRSRKPTPAELPGPLTAYVRLWAVSVTCRVLSRAGAELRFNEAVAACALLAFISPKQPAALLLGLGCRIFAVLASMPYVHDSQYWCLQTDLALVLVILGTLRTRSRNGVVGPAAGFDSKEAASVAAGTASIVRGQFLLFYTAAALFKANTGFMDPYFSCAPIYLVQLMEQNLPDAMLTPTITWLATQAAPTIILGTEALIPVLLWLVPPYGVAFASLFHWAIAITPPPNDIASFGVQTLPRMLLLIPNLQAASTAVTATISEPGWRSAVVVLVASITCALQPITWTEFDYNVPVCGALAAVIGLAVVGSFSGAPKLQQDTKAVAGMAGFKSFLWSMGGIYAVVVLPLGLMDMGAANMFSSLRLHGGSNHYLLPTNLLQRIFVDAPPTTLAGEIFGGGVIRVEGTNSSHFGAHGVRFPGELLNSAGDGCCRPAAVDLLRASGHSGRQWSPMSFSCAVNNRPVSTVSSNASIISSTGEWGFERYTIPAAEMRRLLRDARSRYPEESLQVSGAILPGPEGDETWRANAAAARFVIRRRFDSTGAEHVVCVDEEDTPCAGWVEEQLLAAPSGHWLAMLASKMLLQQPYPLVVGDEGPHRRLHCFGP
jgi:hypothetical protein